MPSNPHSTAHEAALEAAAKALASEFSYEVSEKEEFYKPAYWLHIAEGMTNAYLAARPDLIELSPEERAALFRRENWWDDPAWNAAMDSLRASLREDDR